MSNEGLTSIAVVDNGFNVVGNISTADVRLLTNSSSLPLLKNTCIHFISLILSERGIGDGKDSFPGASTSSLPTPLLHNQETSLNLYSVSCQPIFDTGTHRR